jgi:HSP20 family protein
VFSRERLTIQVDHRNLMVEGEAEIAMPEGMEALWADVRSTRYRRSFALGGEQLDTDAVTANLKDGLLRIDIPKRAEHQPRRIDIQAG